MRSTSPIACGATATRTIGATRSDMLKFGLRRVHRRRHEHTVVRGGTRSAGGYTHGAFGPLGCSWTASGVLENRTVHQNKITQCVYRVTDRITRRSSDLEYRVHARHGSQETLTHAWAAANRQPNANFAQHAVPGRCFVIFVDSCGPHAHRIGHPRPATTPQLIPFDSPHPCDVKKRLKHSHATDIEFMYPSYEHPRRSTGAPRVPP